MRCGKTAPNSIAPHEKKSTAKSPESYEKRVCVRATKVIVLYPEFIRVPTIFVDVCRECFIKTRSGHQSNVLILRLDARKSSRACIRRHHRGCMLFRGVTEIDANRPGNIPLRFALVFLVPRDCLPNFRTIRFSSVRLRNTEQ